MTCGADCDGETAAVFNVPAHPFVRISLALSFDSQTFLWPALRGVRPASDRGLRCRLVDAHGRMFCESM